MRQNPISTRMNSDKKAHSVLSHTRCVPITTHSHQTRRRVQDNLCINATCRTEPDLNSLPATKTRAFGLSKPFGSQHGVQQQPSFTEVLERLREEGANGNAGA